MSEASAPTATAASDADAGAPVVARRSAYLALAAVATLTVPLILWLGRAPLPTVAATIAMGLEALVLGALAHLDGLPAQRLVTLRGALLVGAALLTTPVGWFFGPNAGIAAAISLLVLLTGLLSRRGTTATISWLVYLALAGGELALVLLVVGRVLPDDSLAPVIVPGHPDWHHIVAHGATQVLHLAGFLAGRALRERYAEIQRALDRSVRGAALKGALLEEARHDYRRALRALRKGALSRTGVTRTPESGAPLTAAAPGVADADVSRADVSSPAPVTGATRLWMDAYRTRMRGQRAAVLALCASGFAILIPIGRNRGAVLVALVAITAIAILAVLQREIARRRADESSYWPWALIAGLSVGPAYAFGLHSAFACVIGALLFFGGSFRAAPGAPRVGRRLPVLFAVVLAHGTTFALISLGVVPDDGNLAVLVPGHALLEPLLLHLLLQATYCAAFAAGWAIDARFDVALRDAARAQAVLDGSTAELTRAGTEIARAVEATTDGLFTGERVGRYAVGRLLASGAMGDVYEASDAGTGARVALKLVRADRAAEPMALELLAREARALARIVSPAVARVLDAGVDAELPYVAMELIEGASLADVLRARGRLSMAELRVLGRDLMRGLRDVHDAGVVHRDLKPHNVMQSADPGEDGALWKIVDFGLALHGTSGGEAAGGTAAYVAPEQALGERVDPRADLYSASLVLYRALTGRPAFVGTDMVAIALLARREGPSDPRPYVAVPRDLELVLRIGLAAQPSDRFATARELGSALDAAFDGQLSTKHRARGEALLVRSPWARPSPL